MDTAPTRETVFPPARTKPATRAEMTDRAARAIIEEERKLRDAKTARLRQARLEMEARQNKDETSKQKGQSKRRKSPS